MRIPTDQPVQTSSHLWLRTFHPHGPSQAPVPGMRTPTFSPIGSAGGSSHEVSHWIGTHPRRLSYSAYTFTYEHFTYKLRCRTPSFLTFKPRTYSHTYSPLLLQVMRLLIIIVMLLQVIKLLQLAPNLIGEALPSYLASDLKANFNIKANFKHKSQPAPSSLRYLFTRNAPGYVCLQVLTLAKRTYWREPSCQRLKSFSLAIFTQPLGDLYIAKGCYSEYKLKPP